MLAVASKFLRQIVPPVIATLIAAVLIAGFNRAFSTHLTQPRLGGLHAASGAAGEAAGAHGAAVDTPTHAPEFVIEPVERLWEKGGVREAMKDRATVSIAEPPLLQTPARRTEPRVAEMRPAESRVEPRQAEPYLAPIVVAAPVVAAPAARPDPAFTEPPMVTVPDRARPLPEARIEEPPPPQNPVGMIVNTLKPSSLFARAREFGEKIEAAGNEILPSIRQ